MFEKEYLTWLTPFGLSEEEILKARMYNAEDDEYYKKELAMLDELDRIDEED